MAGPVKTVCFIASAVIVWGLLEVGETIVAWLDYKINGTCIPCHLELSINSIYHLISILIHGLLLHGIRKETTIFMFLYKTLVIVGWIPTVVILYRLTVNWFWPSHFEISRADINWLSIYVTVYFCGELVEEIYKPIKKMEEDKKTMEGEKKTIAGRDFAMVV